MERKACLSRLQAAAQEIDFSSSYQSTSCAGPVALDMHRIEQVLDNLFENALRYTPARGEISLTWSLQPGRLTFLLRDNGPGIAPIDLPRLREILPGKAAEQREAAQDLRFRPLYLQIAG